MPGTKVYVAELVARVNKRHKSNYKGNFGACFPPPT